MFLWRNKRISIFQLKKNGLSGAMIDSCNFEQVQKIITCILNRLRKSLLFMVKLIENIYLLTLILQIAYIYIFQRVGLFESNSRNKSLPLVLVCQTGEGMYIITTLVCLYSRSISAIILQNHSQISSLVFLCFFGLTPV